MIVLGVSVNADLHYCWQRWLAPEVQPFFVDSLSRWPQSVAQPASLSLELRHTYKAWAMCSQGDGHRFVWWPSLVRSKPRELLSRVVAASPDGGEVEALPSRYREVERATWDRCAAALPEARRLAGSFPSSSGPNCFGTVMGAAGVVGAEHERMVQEPFSAWLDAAGRRGGDDEAAGTVLLWRDNQGEPVHAAVTIGDGWALEKGSEEWWTPCAVRAVRDVIRTRRTRGQHLERHRIA